jgi:uncharacterized repeat protein (TIGR01451 family)
MKYVRTRNRSILLFAAAFALSACAGDNPTSPNSTLTPQFNEQDLEAGVFLAKRGAGTSATFSISATGGTLLVGSTVTLSACAVEPCESTKVWEPTPGSTTQEQVTITEISSPANVVLESITVNTPLEAYILDPPPASKSVTVKGPTTGKGLVSFKNILVETPKLRLVKTAVTPTVTVGSNMVFTMSVASEGPATATNVTLTDPLPGGVGIVWSTTHSDCTVTGAAGSQTLNCNFGDMAAGASELVTVTGKTTADTDCNVYENTATVNAGNHASIEASAMITVTGCNETGTGGCTPGYWKQKQHFGSWVGYVPTGTTASTYNAVFGVNLFGSNVTLLQALSTGGGGINRFGRHSTAALLNAANSGVDYGMSVAGVIAAVQAAVASGDFSMIDKLADEFEDRNERNCSLGRAD